MATPSPMRATRNSTIIDTLVTEVTPHRTRNVAMIETIAMSRGTKASSEANTKASTTSAPRPPSTDSRNTPGPPEPPVWFCRA
jgi:hypothetical protein